MDKIGQDGTNGRDGVGVPEGGTAGQVLSKIDGTDYNTQWITINGGKTELFWYTGTRQDPDVAFWNEVYQAQKDHPVWVICANGSGGSYNSTPHFYHLYNSIQNNTTIYSTEMRNNWGNDVSYPQSSYNQFSPYTWTFKFTITNDVVTNVVMTSTNYDIKFLATDKDYNTPYTPLYAGSPATKKYVDDLVGNIETLLSEV